MDWATRRKLGFFIVLFIVLIVVLVLFAIPFFNRPPSCSDGKQNAAESGIDCGGSCQYLCSEQQVPLQILWARAVPSGPKRVIAIAYIRNENKTSGVMEAAYKFTVRNNAGVVISIKEGVTEIPANGNIAVVTSQIDIGEGKAQSTVFEWTKPLYYSSLSDDALSANIETIKTDLDTADETTHLTARVRNTTRQTYKNIPVVVILYNKDDNTVVASRTILDSLGPEEEGEVTFSWNLVITEPITKIEIIPYFKQFAEVAK
jgi:hypothetical protein